MLEVKLSRLSALNLLSCVEVRLEEIDRLATEFPHLPMRDPMTVDSYMAARDELRRVLDMNHSVKA